MNNIIEVNDAPVTVEYYRLNAGDMYRLPCGRTHIYMVLPKSPAGNNVSVNLGTGALYNLSRAKQIVPIIKGTRISIIAGGYT